MFLKSVRFGLAASNKGNKRVERGMLFSMLTLVLFSAAAILLQYRHGRFHEIFHSDANSHYISGLLVRNYLVSDLGGNPIEYLRFFHGHYPLVGIGSWPPLFYFIEGIWMILFGTTKVSILIFSAEWVATTSFLLYLSFRRVGIYEAALLGMLLLLSPTVQMNAMSPMLDIPVACVCLTAIIIYAKYLRTPNYVYSVGFGVIASMALMIKGNAGCLALVPPFAVILARRFDLLLKRSFWLPALIVCAMTGPWYALTYGRADAGFRYSFGLQFFRDAVFADSGYLLEAAGIVVTLIGLSALVRVCASGQRIATASADYLPITAAALLLAVFIFQALVPVALQSRYMIPALPPLFILAGWQIRAWSRSRAVVVRVRSFLLTGRSLQASLFTIMLLSLLPIAASIPVQPESGTAAAARRIWAEIHPANPVVLLAVDSDAEGQAIADLAMNDPRAPSLFAIRGSRLLGGGGYNRQDYVAKYKNPYEVMAAIDKYNIPLVLFRRAGSRAEWKHLVQIEEAQTLFPERWKLIYEDLSTSPEIRLYKILGNQNRVANTAKLLELSAPKALANW